MLFNDYIFLGVLVLNNKLIDESIVIDKSKFDKFILELIQILEKYDSEGDDLNYNLYYPRLEMFVKYMLSKNEISESDYNKILRKYGGYSDFVS